MKKFIKMLAVLATAFAMFVGANVASNEAQAATNETPVHGILTVKYNGRGKVNLLDNNGKYQMQYVSKNSRWKVFAKATINGRVMYRIGSQRQWIPAQYSNVATGSAPVAKKAVTPAKKAASTTKRGGTNQVLVGNRRTKKYHLAGQENYHISPANRVYFHSEAEAIAAGYTKSLR